MHARRDGGDGGSPSGASSNVFWIRCTCWPCSRTSCLRVQVRSRSSWMDVGGSKLARMSHVEIKKAA